LSQRGSEGKVAVYADQQRRCRRLKSSSWPFHKTWCVGQKVRLRLILARFLLRGHKGRIHERQPSQKKTDCVNSAHACVPADSTPHKSLRHAERQFFVYV